MSLHSILHKEHSDVAFIAAIVIGTAVFAPWPLAVVVAGFLVGMPFVMAWIAFRITGSGLEQWMDRMDRTRYGVWLLAPVTLAIMFAPFIAYLWLASVFLDFYQKGSSR